MPFLPGTHSFYGICDVTVVSGTPTFHGAKVSPGSSFFLAAPIYGLPFPCDSSSPFSLRLSPRALDDVLPEEQQFYFPSNPPDGFKELLSGVFYSRIIHGPTYPLKALRSVDDMAARRPCTVLVSGAKGNGKSTFVRYIVNRLLNSCSSVVLLDLDIGQSEISHPGSISLATIRHIVATAPEFHTDAADKVCFYGGTSPSEDPGAFKDSVSYMIRRIPPGLFVVINSFGWVEHYGLELHRELNEMIQPAMVFVIHRPNEPLPEFAPGIFRVEIAPRPGAVSITPQLHRELRILGLFRRGTESISTRQPIPVPTTAVRIGFARVDVSPREALTAICGSLVALCDDDREFSPPSRKVSLLRNVPPMLCRGFAIVRAVDKEKAILYLITPDDKPINFNTIVMGRVFLPAALFADSGWTRPNYLGSGMLDHLSAFTAALMLRKAKAVDGGLTK
jgi:polynucleotide 5'-hydroxyl-kinase GRC3/NOL9